jgi:hypothetical protein
MLERNSLSMVELGALVEDLSGVERLPWCVEKFPSSNFILGGMTSPSRGFVLQNS